MSDNSYVLFTEQDLVAFSEASGDRNPLHISREYARLTPYGQPVVFGCLGAMACLGSFTLPEHWTPTFLEAEFLRPLFVGVRYDISTLEKDGGWQTRLLDGSTVSALLTVKGKILPRDARPEENRFTSVVQLRDTPANWPEGIVPGLTVSGAYACKADALASVARRWRVGDLHLATLLSWASYLVGMELPGEAALFFRLTLNLRDHVLCPIAMGYNASVAYSGFGQAKLNVSLLNGGTPIATGQCWSYIRQPSPKMEEVDLTGVRSDSLAGRAAALIGSSRGLGASIKRALEVRGAAVYGMARSANGVDPSRTFIGDAADAEMVRKFRERVSRSHSSLDFLICNAFPPLLPLLLEPSAVGRIETYIRQAVSLTLAPLTEFLGLLNQGAGCLVIISSSAVEEPVREWPHYVAAKRAVEGLGCVTSMQYPHVSTLIVRPQKLLTTMTNTPLGRMGATSPALLADLIATRLEQPMKPGATEILKCETANTSAVHPIRDVLGQGGG